MDWIEITDWFETRSLTEPPGLNDWLITRGVLLVKNFDRLKNSLRQLQMCLVQFVCFEMLIKTLADVSQRLLEVISAIEIIKLHINSKSSIKKYSCSHGQVDQSFVCSLFKRYFANSWGTLRGRNYACSRANWFERTMQNTFWRVFPNPVSDATAKTLVTGLFFKYHDQRVTNHAVLGTQFPIQWVPLWRSRKIRFFFVMPIM